MSREIVKKDRKMEVIKSRIRNTKEAREIFIQLMSLNADSVFPKLLTARTLSVDQMLDKDG